MRPLERACDRADLLIKEDVVRDRLTADELRGPIEADGSSSVLRERVMLAHARQLHRQATQSKFVSNARLDDRQLLRACAAEAPALNALDDILRRHQQSPRGRVRLLRIARTLADLDDRQHVAEVDIWRAAALRGFTTTTISS